jgi:hypothetical protein
MLCSREWWIPLINKVVIKEWYMGCSRRCDQEGGMGCLGIVGYGSCLLALSKVIDVWVGLEGLIVSWAPFKH